MSRPFKPSLTSRYGIEEGWKLSNAERAGAYEVAKRALTTRKPAELKEEVKKANIRGRGGAGFPAGVKWGFLNKQEGEENAEQLYFRLPKESLGPHVEARDKENHPGQYGEDEIIVFRFELRNFPA